jgi:hypothetical protein
MEHDIFFHNMKVLHVSNCVYDNVREDLQNDNVFYMFYDDVLCDFRGRDVLDLGLLDLTSGLTLTTLAFSC